MLTFTTEKVTDRVTRIYAFRSEMMYLVEGEEKAVLLDTGSGYGSLKTCVDSLTQKPLTVLITHGHVDHAFGAAEFDNVYMNHEDDYIYRQHSNETLRRGGIAKLHSKGYGTFEEADFIPAKPISEFKDLKEGDSFDLGGIHIDTYACSGHTKGSVVFLIREERMLLTGDACNTFTFMFRNYSTDIDTYCKSLNQLKDKVDGKYDRILLSHGSGNGYLGLIEDVITVCHDLMKGKSDEIPFEYKGQQGWIARKDPERSKGNIVYHKDKIYGIV